MKKLLLTLTLLVLAVSAVSAFDGYVVVTNRTGETIYYLNVSHENDDYWGDDVLGSDVIMDGDDYTFEISGKYPSAIFDIRATDSDGNTYTVWGVDVEFEDVTLSPKNMDVADDSFSGYVTVTNDTGFDIYFLYVSHEDSDSWGEDVLGSEILFDGESFTVDLTGYPSSVFDIHAEDEDGDTYTEWGVDVSYLDVTFSLDDLDMY